MCGFLIVLAQTRMAARSDHRPDNHHRPDTHPWNTANHERVRLQHFVDFGVSNPDQTAEGCLVLELTASEALAVLLIQVHSVISSKKAWCSFLFLNALFCSHDIRQ